MDKQRVIEYFDGLAPVWDTRIIRDDRKISMILDHAGVGENVSVLDVACGTGVLIPYYLARGVSKVTGVDISSAMIEIAVENHDDPRIMFINGDIEELPFECTFDRIVVYNAFPHFPDPGRLIKRLTGLLSENGRLTIAHGLSREEINGRHSGTASEVSIGLMSETELSELMSSYLRVDTVISNEDIYVVSGTIG